MTQTEPITSIVGHCLIAMPDMPDPRFQGSVVLLVAHSMDGAMGVIVNKTVEDVRLSDLLSQLSIDATDAVHDIGLYFGGPVEQGRGFVVHTPDYVSGLSTLEVDDGLSMTSTLDILEDTARGQGPEKALVLLGYAGWSEGQLEREIAANGWLVAQATPELIFDTPDDDKWTKALSLIGIDPASLAFSGGSA